MAFENLIESQKEIIEYLQVSNSKNRLVHTYLFEGAKGTNKVETAYYLASMILCNSDNAPCLKCDSCIKVINKDHPNIFFIEPEKDIIKKEQISKLEHEFSLTPLGEKKRVFIIKDIDKCNVQSANSLLKFLEDANEDCYGILISNNINQVLPTIVSRSQVISFKRIQKDAFVHKLVSQGVDLQTSKILSTITNNTDEAKKLISEGRVLDIIEQAKDISKVYFIKEQSPYIEFIKKCSLLLQESKDLNQIFLSIMIIFFKDALSFNLGDIEQIIFDKDIQEINKYIPSDYELIVNSIETILKYKERLKFNINLDLMYAQMFIELGGNNG